MRGDIVGKYLSRIDYLTYFLFCLTTFDPVLIFEQISRKEPGVRQAAK